MDGIIGLVIGIVIVLLYQLFSFVIWNLWFDYQQRKKKRNMGVLPTVEDFESGRLFNYSRTNCHSMGINGDS